MNPNRVSPPRVSLVIPTLDAAPFLPSLREALDRQLRQPDEIIVIDSESSDDTAAWCVRAGWQVERIHRAEFDHGGTRNRGAALASGDIIAFISQDVTPADEHWLSQLVLPLELGQAAATYSRQIARPNASPLEQFARLLNYPPTSRDQAHAQEAHQSIRTLFFSNASSATTRSAFARVGGFPDRTIIGEDAMFASKLLQAGFSIRYVAESRVLHSHDYSHGMQFRRYFDIGAAHAMADSTLRSASTSGEGWRFFVRQLRHTVSEAPLWVPRVVSETVAKYAGYRLGRAHTLLPKQIKVTCSWNRGFWR